MAAHHEPRPFEVRIATAEDLESVLGHRRGMFHDMGYRDPATLDAVVASSRSLIERGLRDGSYRGWLATTAAGQVIGGAGLLITDWVSHPIAPHQNRRAYVLNVYTETDCRGRGVARALMRCVIDYCGTEGFKTVWLHASEYGRPLYESLGFVATNEMKLLLLL